MSFREGKMLRRSTVFIVMPKLSSFNPPAGGLRRTRLLTEPFSLYIIGFYKHAAPTGAELNDIALKGFNVYLLAKNVSCKNW